MSIFNKEIAVHNKGAYRKGESGISVERCAAWENMDSQVTDNEQYEMLLEIIKGRRTCRNFSAKPLPEGAVKQILEAARWAPSGANSQPWSFIVIRSPEMRKKVFNAYCQIDMDLMWWMEQMRESKYRHPGYRVDCDNPEDGLKIKQSRKLWSEAPAIIAVAGDGRKQWGTVLGAHTFGMDQTHLTDSLSNASMLIHLAAASLGLTSQWMSVHTQGPLKEILGIPDPLILHTLIPIGYPDDSVHLPKGGWREPLETMTHEECYDQAKHLNNRQILERLERLRTSTRGLYKPMVK